MRRVRIALITASMLGLVRVQAAVAGTDRWTTQGPPGATLSSVVVAPSQPTTVYAGAFSSYARFGSGVYRSTDGGRHWEAANSGLGDVYINALAVDPASSDVIYVGTYSGVRKSIDGGRSWFGNWTEYESVIDALAIDPFDSQVIYASAYYVDEPPSANLYKSTNGGRSWFPIGEGLPDPGVYSLALDPVTPNTVYAGTDALGVYRSTDGGATWEAADHGLGGAETIISLAIDPQSPSTIYAGAQDYSDDRNTGLYKTVDAGQNWVRVDSGPLRSYPAVQAIAIDPASPATVYVSGIDNHHYRSGGVFKSTDAGQTWAALNEGIFNLTVLDLSVDPSAPRTLFAATLAGAFKTTDGAATWFTASTGMRGTEVESLAVDPTNPSVTYAGTVTAGVFQSTRGGNWRPAREGLSATANVWSLAVDPLQPPTVYAGTIDGNVYKTTDSGRSWSQMSSGLGSSSVLAVAADAGIEGVVYAGTGAGVFGSEDGGLSWSRLFPRSGGYVRTLVADPVTSGTVYASLVGDPQGVFKSVDGGRSWRSVNQGLGTASVFSLAIDPSDSNVVYAGTDCQSFATCVFKSTNGGDQWVPMSEGMQYVTVSSIAIDPREPSNVYAGSYYLGGVYRSVDGGASWERWDDGLMNRDVYSVVVAGGHVQAATFGSGVFDRLSP